MDCVVRVRGPWARLEGPPEARAAARAALTAEVPGARHTRASQSGRWDGAQCLVSASSAFPSGLAERVAAVAGARIQVDDDPAAPAPLADPPPRLAPPPPPGPGAPPGGGGGGGWGGGGGGGGGPRGGP